MRGKSGKKETGIKGKNNRQSYISHPLTSYKLTEKVDGNTELFSRSVLLYLLANNTFNHEF
jgi:hypothetical protein